MRNISFVIKNIAICSCLLAALSVTAQDVDKNSSRVVARDGDITTVDNAKSSKVVIADKETGETTVNIKNSNSTAISDKEKGTTTVAIEKYTKDVDADKKSGLTTDKTVKTTRDIAVDKKSGIKTDSTKSTGTTVINDAGASTRSVDVDKMTSKVTTDKQSGMTTTADGSRKTFDSTTALHSEETDTGYKGGASQTHESSGSRSVGASNAKEGELGGTELKNAQTVGKGEIGAHQEGTIHSDLGDVSGKVDVGASGEVKVGDNGVEASGQIGLAAELEAASKQFAAGDGNIGASVQGSAKLDAMLGAAGKIGAYIDEHGITIGAEAKAGAFVSAQAQINFEAHVFGLSTTVKLSAEAHAGVMAHGEAVVTIGFDGKVKFQIGVGFSVGIGVSASMEFEVDASELVKKLGLANLAELLDWIKNFQKDPKAKLGELFDEAVDRLIKDVVEPTLDKIPIIPGLITVGDVARWWRGPYIPPHNSQMKRTLLEEDSVLPPNNPGIRYDPNDPVNPKDDWTSGKTNYPSNNSGQTPSVPVGRTRAYGVGKP
jgi:hypothetical protein